MFEEFDKGIDTVTAYYVKLRLMRCGLAIVRWLFEWLLFLFGVTLIYHICEMRRNHQRRIPPREMLYLKLRDEQSFVLKPRLLERSHVLQWR